MSNKLFWLALFALIAVSIHTVSALDMSDNFSGFTDPEIDPWGGTFNDSNRMIEDVESDDNAGTTEQNDNQTTQRAQTSSTSNEEIPENEQIHQDGILMDGEYHNYQMRACEFIEVILKRKDLEIRANGVFNAQAILVTNVQFERCDEISVLDCGDDTFCKIQNLQEVRDIQGIQLGNEICEHEVLYLYPIPENQGSPMDFEVKIITGDELQCEASPSSTTSNGDASTEKTEKTEETAPEKSEDELAKAERVCGGHTTIDACQPSEEACSSQCMWITCGVKANGGQPTNTSSSCVPLTFPDERLQARCEANNEFASASKGDQVIDYPICEMAERSEMTDITNIVYHPVSKTIGIIFLVFFILFIMIVCFYRCQFRKYGEGPFSPPSYCPGFIFPRQKLSGFMPIYVDRKHEMMEYQPPVPVL